MGIRLPAWLAPPADVSIFFGFVPPPYGGGNQFLRALKGEFERRGVRVDVNRIPRGTRACLCNSNNFDRARLARQRPAGCRVVHRVDGPIGRYRGQSDDVDRRIWETNRALADATVFQSEYSLRMHRDMGLDFADPVVIPNAADPSIFFPGSRPPMDGRKVRVISTSWSDNPNKGADVYGWLDAHLDFDRYDYTFVGRSPVRFGRIRQIDPVSSAELADLLRAHDIYVTASQHDPCSNALIEALTCGLPAAFRASGGHAELAGEGGVPFRSPEEALSALDRLVSEYDDRRARIRAPHLAAVADRYLDVLGL